ncbi:MAG: hypothetical protein LBE65_05990 [Synergistaceae bacterium]|jgi:hypothetical protein|nr:hypothetical protein [Synergistaceae bacterium]
MPASKRRTRKKYLIFISFFCGALYFAWVRYDFFRLREVDITPDNVVPEEIIWQAFPRKAVDFWPYLIFRGNIFTERVTDFYPVSMKLSFAGWGKYKLTVEPLDVFLSVLWNSEFWLLSFDGRIWRANLPAAVMVNGLKYPARPALIWDSQLPTPIGAERRKGDIYTSGLPMEKIRKWYDTVEKIYWRENIYRILAGKLEGRRIVRILLGGEDRISGEIMMKDDTSDWLSIAAALENIYPRASGGFPAGLVVDTTYTDAKMTVSENGQM